MKSNTCSSRDWHLRLLRSGGGLLPKSVALNVVMLAPLQLRNSSAGARGECAACERSCSSARCGARLHRMPCTIGLAASPSHRCCAHAEPGSGTAQMVRGRATAVSLKLQAIDTGPLLARWRRRLACAGPSSGLHPRLGPWRIGAATARPRIMACNTDSLRCFSGPRRHSPRPRMH